MRTICARCSRPAVYGKGFCEIHLRSATARPKDNPNRKKPNHRYQTPEDLKLRNFRRSDIWLRTRRYKLTSDPWCASCQNQGKLTPASDVDHVRPTRKYWDLRLEETNLQSLCRECHMRKTQREKRGLYYDFERKKLYDSSKI